MITTISNTPTQGWLSDNSTLIRGDKRHTLDGEALGRYPQVRHLSSIHDILKRIKEVEEDK